MSGRGVTITVQVIRADEVQDIHLPVALHSPLEVLKEQLESLTNIPFESQVLILLDLSDTERNSDILLSGRDNFSLRECGIRSGSVLTLHALGQEAQNAMTMEAVAEAVNFSSAASSPRDGKLKRSISSPISRDLVSKRSSPAKTRAGISRAGISRAGISETGISSPNLAVLEPEEEIHTLETAIRAADADHSYNGIIFDVICKGPFEIELKSISIGGMLGRIRIFVRDRPWSVDNDDAAPSSNWWAYSRPLSTTGWRLVYDNVLLPSWDRHHEVRFTEKIVFLPHSRHGLYCHSSLPDDLGIQYQSYGDSQVVADDEYIQLTPGLGHTGSLPFDNDQGWYKACRGLAGAVSYSCRRKGWNISQHLVFPQQLRDAVRCLLLCHHRCSPQLASSSSSSALPASSSWYQLHQIGRLPLHTIYFIMEFMHWDWFEECTPKTHKKAEGRESSRRTASSIFSRLFSGRHNTHSESQASQTAQVIGDLSGNTATTNAGSIFADLIRLQHQNVIDQDMFRLITSQIILSRMDDEEREDQELDEDDEIEDYDEEDFLEDDDDDDGEEEYEEDEDEDDEDEDEDDEDEDENEGEVEVEDEDDEDINESDTETEEPAQMNAEDEEI